jgi:hypothetical protein
MPCAGAFPALRERYLIEWQCVGAFPPFRERQIDRMLCTGERRRRPADPIAGRTDTAYAPPSTSARTEGGAVLGACRLHLRPTAMTGSQSSGTSHQCVTVSASATLLWKKRGRPETGCCSHSPYALPMRPTYRTHRRADGRTQARDRRPRARRRSAWGVCDRQGFRV